MDAKLKIGLVTSLLIILLVITLSCGRKAETTDVVVQEEEQKAVKGVQIENILAVCLEKEQLDDKCKLIFSDLKIAEKCAGLDNSDDCYYKIALFQQDVSLCDKINNENLRNQCEKELEVGFLIEGIE